MADEKKKEELSSTDINRIMEAYHVVKYVMLRVDEEKIDIKNGMLEIKNVLKEHLI